LWHIYTLLAKRFRDSLEHPLVLHPLLLQFVEEPVQLLLLLRHQTPPLGAPAQIIQLVLLYIVPNSHCSSGITSTTPSIIPRRLAVVGRL
jgi:hypothetical protein